VAPTPSQSRINVTGDAELLIRGCTFALVARVGPQSHRTQRLWRTGLGGLNPAGAAIGPAAMLAPRF